ncbi:MAG: hypothetical protein ACKO34_02580 [Vampirovibrionales bacterium]
MMMMMGGQLGTDPSSIYLQMAQQQAQPRQGYSYSATMPPPSPSYGAYPTSPAPQPYGAAANNIASYQRPDTFTAQRPDTFPQQAHMAPPVAHPPIAAEEAKGPNWLGIGTTVAAIGAGVWDLRRGNVSLLQKAWINVSDWLPKMGDTVQQAASKAVVDENAGKQFVTSIQESRELMKGLGPAGNTIKTLWTQSVESVFKPKEGLEGFWSRFATVKSQAKDGQMVHVLEKARSFVRGTFPDSTEANAKLLEEYIDFAQKQGLPQPVLTQMKALLSDPTATSKEGLEKLIKQLTDNGNLNDVEIEMKINGKDTPALLSDHLKTLLTFRETAKLTKENSEELVVGVQKVIRQAADNDATVDEATANVIIKTAQKQLHELSEGDLRSFETQLKSFKTANGFTDKAITDKVDILLTNIADLKTNRTSALGVTHGYLDFLTSGAGLQKGTGALLDVAAENGITGKLGGVYVKNIELKNITNNTNVPNTNKIEVPYLPHAKEVSLSTVDDALDGTTHNVLRMTDESGKTFEFVVKTDASTSTKMNVVGYLEDGKLVEGNGLPKDFPGMSSFNQATTKSSAHVNFKTGASNVYEANRSLADKAADVVDRIQGFDIKHLKNQTALENKITRPLRELLASPGSTQPKELIATLQATRDKLIEGLGDSFEDRILAATIKREFDKVIKASQNKTVAEINTAASTLLTQGTGTAGSLGQLFDTIGKLKLNNAFEAIGDIKDLASFGPAVATLGKSLKNLPLTVKQDKELMTSILQEAQRMYQKAGNNIGRDFTTDDIANRIGVIAKQLEEDKLKPAQAFDDLKEAVVNPQKLLNVSTNYQRSVNAALPQILGSANPADRLTALNDLMKEQLQQLQQAGKTNTDQYKQLTALNNEIQAFIQKGGIDYDDRAVSGWQGALRRTKEAFGLPTEGVTGEMMLNDFATRFLIGTKQIPEVQSSLEPEQANALMEYVATGKMPKVNGADQLSTNLRRIFDDAGGLFQSRAKDPRAAALDIFSRAEDLKLTLGEILPLLQNAARSNDPALTHLLLAMSDPSTVKAAPVSLFELRRLNPTFNDEELHALLEFSHPNTVFSNSLGASLKDLMTRIYKTDDQVKQTTLQGELRTLMKDLAAKDFDLSAVPTPTPTPTPTP